MASPSPQMEAILTMVILTKGYTIYTTINSFWLTQVHAGSTQFDMTVLANQ